LAAWGATGGHAGFKDPKSALSKYGTNQGRLFVFKLGGRQHVTPLPREEGEMHQAPPALEADAAMLQKGFDAYHRNCLVCHGFYAQSEGVVPDLRTVPRGIWDNYDAIVLGGALAGGGMASFKDIL